MAAFRQKAELGCVCEKGPQRLPGPGGRASPIPSLAWVSQTRKDTLCRKQLSDLH